MPTNPLPVVEVPAGLDVSTVLAQNTDRAGHLTGMGAFLLAAGFPLTPALDVALRGRPVDVAVSA